MSRRCNGIKSGSRAKSDFVERLHKAPSLEDSEEAPLEGFRGFGKVPAVIVQRVDITPYLNHKNNRNSQQNVPKTGVLDELFFTKCAVNLVKEDLFTLKRSLSRSSLDSDGQMVDQDANMVNLKCKICGKVYSSEKKLLNHQENKHMLIYKPPKPQKRVSFSDKVIIHEVKEYHKCRKCPKIFENYRSLKVHMKLRHKKRKCYICNYCNKNFVDRMFFKVHIKLHCDICGVLLPNKSKYLEHRRIVCRVLKMHNCKTCDGSFFKFMDLKDHSYEHISTVYVCDICKDQCSSKCAVAHHISFLHSEERPTSLYSMRNLGSERLYLCNFCDESSVDRDYIEHHVQQLPDLNNRAMTGYKDYYFCEQCLQKFDTEKSMLQHKWTHYLKTSENSILKSILANKKAEPKRFYKIDEVPNHMQPKIVLEKIKVGGKVLTENVDYVDVKSFDINHSEIKKPVVDPKSKKTIISKHQCEVCITLFILI